MTSAFDEHARKAHERFRQKQTALMIKFRSKLNYIMKYFLCPVRILLYHTNYTQRMQLNFSQVFNEWNILERWAFKIDVATILSRKKWVNRRKLYSFYNISKVFAINVKCFLRINIKNAYDHNTNRTMQSKL